MRTLIAVLSVFAGVFATLTMLTLLLAGAPNSPAAGMRMLTSLMWGVALFGLAAAGGGLWLLAGKRRRLAAIVGAAPVPVFVVLFAVLVAVTAP